MQETVKKEYIEREAVLIYAKMLVHTAYERKEKITDEEIEKLVYGIHADFTGAELGAIPAAHVVEVRHGRWAWDENGMDWGLGAWKCSECHRKPETWWEADKGNPYRCAGSRYCNNCGAKMDGV